MSWFPNVALLRARGIVYHHWYWVSKAIDEVSSLLIIMEGLYSLSHRPTLITNSIVFWKIWNLFHENASPSVGREPTIFVALSSAHRTIHLRHGGWRNWQKLAGFDCYVMELLALCYCLFLCLFWLRHKPNTCSLLKVVGSSPTAANFFLFECLIWE